jgi:hypothetical protein
MVPMSVRNEQREAEMLLFKFIQQRLSQQAQSGAGVEYNNVVTGANFYASGIASKTYCTAARSGYGAADTPEFDGGATFDAGNLTHDWEKIKFKFAGES